MTAITGPQLRPLTMPRLLDQAVRLYRQNFLTFVGIIAIVQIPLTIVQLAVSLLAFGDFFAQLENLGRSPNPEDIFTVQTLFGFAASFFLAILGFILVQGLATAALTQAVANSYLSHRLGIIESYQKLGRSWLSLILALFLAGVFGIGLILWTIVPCVGWLSGLGMLAFYSLVVVPLIAPIIVLEKQQASHAIRRAWDLARRRFWWVLGFVFILFLFNQMVVTAPVTLATYIFQFVIGDPTNPSASQFTLQTIIQSITTLVFSLIYLPLQMTAITLLYFDLRIRTEGFDMDVLVASVTTDDDSQANPTDLVAHAPPPQRGNWVTGAELGYFVLIEIGAVALYFVVVVVVLGLIFALLGVANSF